MFKPKTPISGRLDNSSVAWTGTSMVFEPNEKTPFGVFYDYYQ
jgi:hypothetical protein